MLNTLRSFLCGWPGLGPAAEVLVLCFAKEKYPKERRAEIGVPSLRYGHLALLNFSGGTCKLASLKQAHSLTRKSLRCSVTLNGKGGIGHPCRWCAGNLCGDEHLPSAGRRPGVLERERSKAPLAVPCRYEELSNAVFGGSGLALFERSEFSETPTKASSARCPRSGPTNPARLSFGYFSLAKQRRSTSPAGARPGQQTQNGEEI